MTPSNIADGLLSRAEEVPDRIGLAFEDGRTWTFRNLADRISQVADGLEELGVGPGSRVALYMPNCPEMVWTIYATLALGAVLVPNNIMLQASELQHSLSDSGAEFLVTKAGGPLSLIDGVEAAQSLKTVVVFGIGHDEVAGRLSAEEWLTRQAQPRKPVRASPDDEALLMYTSGTTGKPKGVVRTYGSISATVDAQAARLRGREGPYPAAREGTPPNLIPLPLANGGGLFSVFFAYRVGRSVLLMERFRVDDYFRLVEQWRVDSLFGTPTMFQMMLTAPQRPELTSVKVALCGGAPLPAAVAEAFETDLGIPLIQTYGQTEAGHIAGWSVKDIQAGSRKPGSVGKAYPGVDLRIVSDSGSSLLAGQIGEVICSGPGIMTGYLNQESETAATVSDGWLRTGDLGYLDEDGCLFLVGRQREVIIAGGFNIYPAELEEALLAHPDIAEAAVVSAPDERLGEVPVAFLAAKPGRRLEHDELQCFFRERLAAYKRPRETWVLDELPKQATNNKTDRAKLKVEALQRLRDEYIEGPQPK